MPHYVGKPRPGACSSRVVIAQDDRFGDLASATICPLTIDRADAPLLCVAIAPSATNGLKTVSRIMVDKITTVQKGQLTYKIGRLADADLRRLNRAALVFLGLVGEEVGVVKGIHANTDIQDIRPDLTPWSNFPASHQAPFAARGRHWSSDEPVSCKRYMLQSRLNSRASFDRSLSLSGDLEAK